MRDAQYRGSGETLKREEFEARKKAAEEAKASKLRNAPKKLASADKDLSHFPFLHNLAEREDLVRNGKLTSIIFLRDKNSKGQEVGALMRRQAGRQADRQTDRHTAHNASMCYQKSVHVSGFADNLAILHTP